MKSKSVAPDWNGPLNFDEKEDVLAIDESKNVRYGKGGCGSTSTPDNSTQLEVMKARMSDMEKENQELRSLFLQTLQALRNGNIYDDVFNGIQFALSKPNTRVASAASGNSARNGDDLPPSSNS